MYCQTFGNSDYFKFFQKELLLRTKQILREARSRSLHSEIVDLETAQQV